MKIGDIVGRKSYDMDTIFRIECIDGDTAQLKGIFFRLMADANLSDLASVCDRDFRQAELDEAKHYEIFAPVSRGSERMTEIGLGDDFYISGRILHIDGDNEYLGKSAKLYENANVYATTLFVEERLMPSEVPELVRKLRPNIVVITGHDSLDSKSPGDSLDGYKSSKFFVSTVNELRNLEPALDCLIIIAGACQSHFEALIGSGANFASSPKRINIHALDPAIVAATVALTPYEDQVDLKEAIEKTITKIAGIGGLQTKGTLRYGIKS